MWNARTKRPSGIGLASSGLRLASSLKPSPRPSMPKRPSNEWFSIITMTMCSILGSVSVPSGRVGFGREPGLRSTFGIVDGDGDTVAPEPRVVAVGGPDVLEDDEQPVSSAIATPAPATASPFSTERRLTGMSGGCMAMVYRAHCASRRRPLFPGRLHAPLPSGRCAVISLFLGRLHAPLPSGRCAVVSLRPTAQNDDRAAGGDEPRWEPPCLEPGPGAVAEHDRRRGRDIRVDTCRCGNGGRAPRRRRGPAGPGIDEMV